jgi:diguanylate cyclase (GGDEF)-like protein
MQNKTSDLREALNRPAIRDALVIILCACVAWSVIERTEICTEFFAWVAANPDYEVDSVILAFILSSFGITIYAVRRYREAKLAVLERQHAEARATQMAYHDTLTGLPNRRALINVLDKKIDDADAKPFDLLFIDLDRFKGINDVHGHLAGDQVLRIVADRLRNTLEKGQHIYRMGGDEFAIIEGHDGDTEQTDQLARRLIVALSQPIDGNGLVHHIGASVGIARYPQDASERLNLMRRADVALYRAKEGGRGCFYAFEQDMDAHLRQRALLETELGTGSLSSALPAYPRFVDRKGGRL